ERDRGHEHRLEGGVRRDRGDPHRRFRVLPERGRRRLHRALRDPAAALRRPWLLTRRPVATAQSPPSAARTSGAPSRPRKGPERSTGPSAKRTPERRVTAITSTPSAPLSSATPSSAAMSTSPPNEAAIRTTTGSVFASPIPSTIGAISATRIAPRPSTSARTAATRRSWRSGGSSTPGTSSAAATAAVSTPTHRFGRRRSAPSTHDSTTAGGRYATSSTPTRNGEISGTPPLDQNRRGRGGVGAPLWTATRRR